MNELVIISLLLFWILVVSSKSGGVDPFIISAPQAWHHHFMSAMETAQPQRATQSPTDACSIASAELSDIFCMLRT